MLNGQSILDTTKLITGKDGQLFLVLKNNTQIFLAEVDTFKAEMSMSNVDYQPVGSALEYAVPTGYSVTLTLTEAVVRDDLMLKTLFDDIKQGYFPLFNFSGKLRRRDGSECRQIFRNCLPDSSVDLMSLEPGKIVKRSWNFRVNSIPEMMEYFVMEDM